MNKTILAIIIIIILLFINGCDKETESIITQDKMDCQEACANESLTLRYVSLTSSTLYCHCEKIITAEVE